MELDSPVREKSGHKMSHNGNHVTIELSVIYVFLSE